MRRTLNCIVAIGLLLVGAAPLASADWCYGLGSDAGCHGAWFPDNGVAAGLCVGIRSYEPGHCTGAQL